MLRAKTPPKEKTPRPSALDPFRPLIHKLVIDGLSAVRVHEEIRGAGYSNGYTILKDFIRDIRPKPIVRPHLRFETEPGEQGQVDLSPYVVMFESVPTSVVCFSFVLGYSRWQFIRFFHHADVHAVCHGHVLAFDAAGGAPHEILYDRMKQVVLESHRDGVVLHPLFERLAQHYGFRVVPLAPGYKEGKGKVENPFRYVENNFLAGRFFRDVDDLNRQAAEWLAKTAHVRIHRTTQERPIDRLVVERSKIIPIPMSHFDAAVVLTRLVGDDFCVAWETNRYSVPPRLAGHTVKIRVLEGRLEVEAAGEPIASHRIRDTRHKRYIAPEHEAEFRRTSTSRLVLGEQFRRLGPVAERFADGLVEARGGAAGYHMGQILRLSERVGVPRILEALRHAARYGAFDHNAVARIVGAKPSRARATTRDDLAVSPMQHVDRYLEGAGTHQRTPERYQRLLTENTALPSHEENQEDNDGE